MEKSSFRGRVVAQVDVGDSQKFLHLIFIGMELDLFFEFLARLRITFVLIVFQIGVAEKTVGPRILRIEPDRLAKLKDSLLRKLSNQVGPSKEHVQRRRISHRGLKLMEPRGGLSQFLGLQVSDPQKIAGFEIVL